MGRRKPIIIGYALTLILLFPIFHMIGAAGNPALRVAAERAPIVVSGPDCTYDPFAKSQVTDCGKLLDFLSKKGVRYVKVDAPYVAVSVGGEQVGNLSPESLEQALAQAGYDLTKVRPDAGRILVMLIGIAMLGALSGATYGPVAALLSELFPARIRYSSMSIPYHIGTGYFGGFLPLVSQYVVAKTGDPYAGLWYTMAVVAMALIVSFWGLEETRGRPLDAET